MTRYCGKCGKLLSQGQPCSCNKRNSNSNVISISSKLNDVQDSFLSLQNTIVSFVKSPVHTTYENARYKNWITATILILFTLIFQSLANQLIYMKYGTSASLETFFKVLFLRAVPLCVFVISIFMFSRLLNNTKNEFIKTYSALGIALIPVIAGSLLVCALSVIYNEISYVVMNFAKIFTLLTITLAIKKIDGIRRDDILILVASISGFCYSLTNFILNRIL